MWMYKLNNYKTEQSSAHSAEDILPKTMTYIDHCNRLKLTEEYSAPNTMCFYSPDGSVCVGICLEETQDSFLVGATARLVMGRDRQISAESISANPVIRLFKSSLRYTVLPTEMTCYHYFAFIEEFGYSKLPDYFTQERKDYVTSVRNNSQYKVQPDLSSMEDTGQTKPEVPGDSEFSFVPYTQSESIH